MALMGVSSFEVGGAMVLSDDLQDDGDDDENAEDDELLHGVPPSLVRGVLLGPLSGPMPRGTWAAAVKEVLT
ncbi:hypothetical protein GCM10027273_09160 [Nocardioides pakistanensis]